MIRNNSISIIFALLIISCGLNPSKITQSDDLANYNKDYQFFTKTEMDELLQLDSLFNSHLNPKGLDIDSIYNDFLFMMISEANEKNMPSCEMTTLVSLSKLNCKDYLSKSTVDKIFTRSDGFRGVDKVHFQYDEINPSGHWIKFLDSYATKDTILIGYINSSKEIGTFPPFFVFEDYDQFLDFDNQIHRLIVIMHILNRISMWPYSDC
jgi:hypothetical protein